MREYLEPFVQEPDPIFPCWTCGQQVEWEERCFKCEGCSRTYHYDEICDHYKERQYDEEDEYAV